MLTDEQKALRRSGITATDAAAILGLSPFKSPLDVYREKRGEQEPVPAQIELEGGELRETKDTERGRYLERALVEWTGARLKVPTEHTPDLTVRCAWDPLIMASPDGWVYTDQRLPKDQYPLEVKAPGTFWRSDEWGPDGADAEGNVPAGYEVQLRIQLAATSSDVGYLAALIGPELRVYRLQRDVELEKQMVARLHEWHERHVVADVPPAPTLMERDQRWLKARYPHDKLPPMKQADLNADQRYLVERLLLAYRERKTWNDTYDSLKNELQQILGDHAGLSLSGGGRIDWKSNKPSKETDWEALARDLHRRLALLAESRNATRMVKPFETEVESFTKTVPGNRVFRPWPKKEK